jgi:hypothetical protein
MSTDGSPRYRIVIEGDNLEHLRLIAPDVRATVIEMILMSCLSTINRELLANRVGAPAEGLSVVVPTPRVPRER